MIDFSSYNIRIDSAFPISWKKGTAYASSRKYDAISFRVNGDATYRHGEREYTAKKNDLLFIPAGYDYSITANKDEDVLVVHFYIENSHFDEISVFTPHNPDVFERIFDDMCKAWRTKPTGYRYKMYSLFYKMLGQIEIQEEQKNAVLKPKKLQKNTK